MYQPIIKILPYLREAVNNFHKKLRCGRVISSEGMSADRARIKSGTAAAKIAHTGYTFIPNQILLYPVYIFLSATVPK